VLTLCCLKNASRRRCGVLGLVEVPNYVTSVKAAVSIWTFVTVALTALLLFLVVGGFYRTRRTATNPP